MCDLLPPTDWLTLKIRDYRLIEVNHDKTKNLT